MRYNWPQESWLHGPAVTEKKSHLTPGTSGRTAWPTPSSQTLAGDRSGGTRALQMLKIWVGTTAALLQPLYGEAEMPCSPLLFCWLLRQQCWAPPALGYLLFSLVSTEGTALPDLAPVIREHRAQRSALHHPYKCSCSPDCPQQHTITPVLLKPSRGLARTVPLLPLFEMQSTDQLCIDTWAALPIRTTKGYKYRIRRKTEEWTGRICQLLTLQAPGSWHSSIMHFIITVKRTQKAFEALLIRTYWSTSLPSVPHHIIYPICNSWLCKRRLFMTFRQLLISKMAVLCIIIDQMFLLHSHYPKRVQFSSKFQEC